MSPTHTNQEPAELDRAMSQLVAISDKLRSSYAELKKRAERVEEELSRTNAELARQVAERDALLASLPTGVVVRSEDGTIVRANPAAQAILGEDEAQLLGKSRHDGLLGSEGAREPQEYTRPDGTTLVVASRSAEFRSSDGKNRGSVEILDDQTEVRELADELHRLDKMAALGTMAGGIAHEVRNPLNAIRGFAELLGRNAGEDERSTRWTRRIIDGVDEIDSIIDSMLTFASPERMRLEEVDARELVRSGIDAALASRPDAGADRWKVSGDADPVRFRADRIKLRQSLRNLVANALDVQPEGGSVDVTLKREDDVLVVRVLDEGPGVPAGAEKRLTDPFFTTRAEGTGLGLALVHTIARLHGGGFEIGSRPAPERGALAVMRIPFTSVS